MICTVGLSPTPVALSILTQEPQKLVLVCTPSTRSVARAVEQLVAEHDEYRESPTDVRVVEIAERAARDLKAIHESLATELIGAGTAEPGTLLAALNELGSARPTLDYTGGTAVMVAGCVEFHRRLLEYSGVDQLGILQRRSYVAIGNDLLRFDDGAAIPLDDSLGLEARARLHGVELVGWRRGKVDVSQLAQCAKTLNEAHQQANRRKDANPVLDWMTSFEETGPFRWSSHTRTKQPLFATNVGADGKLSHLDGAVAEALTLIQVEHALHSVPGATYRETWVNARAFTDGEPNSFAEFDLLTRVGNTIIMVETKRSSSDEERVEASLFRLLRSMPLTFGASLRMLLLPLLTSKSALDERLRRSAELLGVPQWRVGTVLDVASIPNVTQALGRTARGIVRAALTEQFREWIPSRPLPASPHPDPSTVSPSEPADVNDSVEGTLTISGIGGSPLAVESASLALPGAERLFVIGSEPLLDALPIQAFVTPIVSRFDPQSSVSARTALLRAAGDHPRPRFVITPGTKAVTAAMVDVAAELARNGREVDLLHIDSEHDQIVTRSGRPAMWNPRRAIAWPHILTAQTTKFTSLTALSYDRFEPDDDASTALARLPAPLARTALSARDAGIPIAVASWPNTTTLPKGSLLPYLVLLGQRRIVIAAYVQSTDTQASKAYRLESQAILHNLQYGPIARTLIVITDDEKPRKDLIKVLNTWRGARLFTTVVSPQRKTATMVRWQPEVAPGHLEALPPEENWTDVKAFLEGRVQ